MLKQYNFELKISNTDNIYSELAVKLHGALMSRLNEQDIRSLHENKYHPFSLYCVPAEESGIFLASVSSLHENGDMMISAAVGLDSVIIKGAGRAAVIRKGAVTANTLDELTRNINGRKFRLMFLTPSAFKVAGKETGFPDVTMHFISVLRKMQEFEGLQIDFDMFRKAFYQCRLREWQFREYQYNISGIHVPGMTGSVDIELPDTEIQHLLKKVFLYASFSGTGGRTGMGMGGFLFMRI